MEVMAVASGSSGNCFYVGDGSDGILIDAGVSCRRICDSLVGSGVSLEKIRGIFVTHEHIDHVRGIDVLSRKLGVPVFASRGTMKSFYLGENLRIVKSGESLKVGNLRVDVFDKFHDAAEPVSYSVSSGGKRASVLTDLGKVCSGVSGFISKSDFIFLESNHDVAMLEEGRYPIFLKRRILGELGHLSNLQAALAVLEHGGNVKKVVLSHLSSNNNTPELAVETFEKLMRERISPPEILVSDREEATGLLGV